MMIESDNLSPTQPLAPGLARTRAAGEPSTRQVAPVPHAGTVADLIEQMTDDTLSPTQPPTPGWRGQEQRGGRPLADDVQPVKKHLSAAALMRMGMAIQVITHDNVVWW
ncbi:hypothetical protein CALVIDRAFT_603088 [Calocera viscosa TUFC12733]|uniref:Uncharacterized protein n=1 Tax=Calocera viscosa (strain TUFC12733) TaxID=1330018 RepID=A0A167G6Z4_CALVF|nr:hypothetical protein CALVIDRAFT_603088 [Calocera viscosa TUFC12733]